MSQPTYAALGQFCWPEIASSDIAATKDFYTRIFGWEPVDLPSAIGPYTIFKCRELDAAAAYQLNPQQTARPRWNSYVAVESADQAAKKARELGGSVVMEPFDVEGVMRMAIIHDPGGAKLCLWQSLSHFGAGIFGKPGSLCWTELATRDTKQAMAFYSGLFGWEGQAKEQGEFVYTELWLDNVAIGGMLGMEGTAWEGMPEQWTPYFAVEDCEAIARAAESLNASLLSPPTDIPGVGRFAMIRDPQGAVFSVIKLAEQ